MSIALPSGDSHFKRLLIAIGVGLAVIVIGVWGIRTAINHFRGAGAGGSDTPTADLHNLPLAVTVEPGGCDPCQLWFEDSDNDGFWHLHAGTVGQAAGAVERGAMLVKEPEVGT